MIGHRRWRAFFDNCLIDCLPFLSLHLLRDLHFSFFWSDIWHMHKSGLILAVFPSQSKSLKTAPINPIFTKLMLTAIIRRRAPLSETRLFSEEESQYSLIVTEKKNPI